MITRYWSWNPEWICQIYVQSCPSPTCRSGGTLWKCDHYLVWEAAARSTYHKQSRDFLPHEILEGARMIPKSITCNSHIYTKGIQDRNLARLQMLVVRAHEVDLLTIWLPLVTALSTDGEKASPENKVNPSFLPSDLVSHSARTLSTKPPNFVTSIVWEDVLENLCGVTR